MSWRVTLGCSRQQAESLPDAEDLFPGASPTPVIVADEPDPSRPDEWLIHAYFERAPTGDELKQLERHGTGKASAEQLGEADWVAMSQSGLQPIRAGRFFVHTPMYRSTPPGTVAFEIDAGLAFGTGQHATTAGCLEVLDRLQHDDHDFSNVADIGTGTGLLAFAALALWPTAKCIATDIDAIAVEVARENAAINDIALGHGQGELLLAQADGMDSPLLSARAPFDLVVANILAGPLIDLAGVFTGALAEHGRIVLAGVLDSQAERVAEAYVAAGLHLDSAGSGEWPVLLLHR